MNKFKILIFFIFISTTLFAQKTILLNAKSRTEIVNNISKLLLDNYIFPDTALKMSDCIKHRLKAGAYNKITDPVAFSDALTIDLYSVYRDGHMLVQYDPQFSVPSPTDTSKKQTAEEDPFKKIKTDNFGLKKLEILNGNIGYINLDHFWADDTYGKETVKAALQFVSYTNALIIDLRDCGGGSQETVNLISGYFMEKATHLIDIYDRPANTTTAYWTKPDSTFNRLTKIPLYILTNNKTFSAAEAFCYGLQSVNRAIIIGEATGGGAHGTFSQDAGYGLYLSVPYSNALSPITKSNWEKTGVQPTIKVAPDKALETAEMKVFETLVSNRKDDSELFNLQWDLDLLKAINNPVVIDSVMLKKFAGVYGERVFTFENGKLFYKRTGRPKFEMEPMTSTIMKAKGNNYFKIEFIEEQGKFNKVNAYYQDNREESSIRTQ